jgi:hypothetical protein
MKLYYRAPHRVLPPGQGGPDSAPSRRWRPTLRQFQVLPPRGSSGRMGSRCSNRDSAEVGAHHETPHQGTADQPRENARPSRFSGNTSWSHTANLRGITREDCSCSRPDAIGVSSRRIESHRRSSRRSSDAIERGCPAMGTKKFGMRMKPRQIRLPNESLQAQRDRPRKSPRTPVSI